MITKVTTQANNSNSNNVDFKSTGKRVYSAPTVVETIQNDNGENVYVLESGNTILQDKYDAMWNRPKTLPNFKARGVNPDGRKNWM